jgi:hypothetical protein
MSENRTGPDLQTLDEQGRLEIVTYLVTEPMVEEWSKEWHAGVTQTTNRQVIM